MALFAAVAVTVLTWSGVAAVFTGSANSASSFGVGSVTLTDDDAASAMFTESNLALGSSLQRCIQITYIGTTNPLPVRLYSTGAIGGTGLASYLTLSIEEGTGGSWASCTGFTPAATLTSGGSLEAFAGSATGWSTGLVAWDPASGGESRTYRITLQASSDSAAAGLSATGFEFTWEARS